MFGDLSSNFSINATSFQTGSLFNVDLLYDIQSHTFNCFIDGPISKNNNIFLKLEIQVKWSYYQSLPSYSELIMMTTVILLLYALNTLKIIVILSFSVF